MNNREGKDLSDNNYITSDIGIAAFLHESKQCQALSLEFLNSEYCKFDNNVRNLKKLLFS